MSWKLVIGGRSHGRASETQAMWLPHGPFGHCFSMCSSPSLHLPPSSLTLTRLLLLQCRKFLLLGTPQLPVQCTHSSISADLRANMSQSSPSPSSFSPIEAYTNGDFTEQGCMKDFSMVEADEGREAGEFPSPYACLSLPLLHICTMP